MPREPIPPPPLAAPTPADATAGPRAVPHLLAPLRVRDFRFLWIGLSVSLVGDGIYYVALAWQVYDLSNAPTALSIVSLAWSAPMVVFLLGGGIATDRFDRRLVLITADVMRALAIGTMGLLSVAGTLQLGHVIVLAVVYGIGQALFGPAFGAIVPDVVERDQLLQANSLTSFSTPFGERLAGPAIGGIVVGTWGAGTGLLLDAASFAVSALMIAAMAPRPRPAAGERAAIVDELKEGFAFVRGHRWLWGTLVSAGVTLLFVLGPWEVLLPWLARNRLEGGAAGLGMIYAAGGVGAVAAAVLMGRRRLPKRHITFMYVTWGIGILTVAGFAFITEVWQGMLLEAIGWSLFTAGDIVWNTLMHTHVPAHLLGRVTSVDWLVSTSLTPISFAVTGPLADAVGINPVLIGAGFCGAATTFAFLALPGMRDTEKGAPLTMGDPVS